MRVPEEEVGELDKPPSTKSPIGRHAAPWRVALLAHLKSDGHWVTFLPADHTLPDSLHRLRPHICFNISEGLSGDAREAQVPALCELLAIPYTGSRVMANSLSLEKTLTKRIWRDHGLPTARFQEFTSSEDPLDPELRFPLFVKPAREGTGMGIDLAALAKDEADLRARGAWRPACTARTRKRSARMRPEPRSISARPISRTGCALGCVTSPGVQRKPSARATSPGSISASGWTGSPTCWRSTPFRGSTRP